MTRVAQHMCRECQIVVSVDTLRKVVRATRLIWKWCKRNQNWTKNTSRSSLNLVDIMNIGTFVIGSALSSPMRQRWTKFSMMVAFGVGFVMDNLVISNTFQHIKVWWWCGVAWCSKTLALFVELKEDWINNNTRKSCKKIYYTLRCRMISILPVSFFIMIMILNI